jgi:hypothetical protein
VATTAGDIIQDALQAAGVIGVGQVPLAENTQLALRHLNRMIGQWNRKRWLVYHLIDTSFTCDGSQSYSVGPGQQFDIARPDRLEAAFFRQTTTAPANQIDYQLQILQSMEDYSKIALKQLVSFGYYIFYDSGFPTGRVYPWPLLQNQYDLHIITKAVLTTFDDLATAFDLPPEYEEAIEWNLALRLRPLFQLPPDDTITGMANASLNTVRGANTQISRLTMPAPLNSNGIYNIYSDQNGTTA